MSSLVEDLEAAIAGLELRRTTIDKSLSSLRQTLVLIRGDLGMSMSLPKVESTRVKGTGQKVAVSPRSDDVVAALRPQASHSSATPTMRQLLTDHMPPDTPMHVGKIGLLLQGHGSTATEASIRGQLHKFVKDGFLTKADQPATFIRPSVGSLSTGQAGLDPMLVEEESPLR